MRKIVECPSGNFVHAMCPKCGNRDVDTSDLDLGFFIHCTICDKYWSYSKNQRSLEYEWKEYPQLSLILNGPPIMRIPDPELWVDINALPESDFKIT